jgi:hypothetical protein
MNKFLRTTMLVLTMISTSTYGCTIFYCSDGSTILVGNNEDNTPTLKSYLWYYPKNDSKHGYVTWGNVKKLPEGGMNEKGLFWDAAAMPNRIPIVINKAKNNFKGYFVEKALGECATVEELVNLISKYNLIWQEKAQIFVADATGDYAIIHANYIMRKADIKTNYFSLANYCLKDAESANFQCHRQGYAQKALSTQPIITKELFRNILAKTAQTYVTNATLYSQICDLKNGTFQLFQKYNFDEKKEINLKEELEKGERTVEIKDYFPKNIADEISPLFEKKEYAKASVKYDELKTNEPALYSFLFKNLDELGFKFLRGKKNEEAMEVFKLNLRHFPNSDLALSSLGCAYLTINDTINAHQLFDKALAINSDNYMANIFKPKSKGKIVFTVKHFEGVEKLSIAGTFNDWKPNVNTFTRDKNGDWTCELSLNAGEYTYKFVVGDGNWYADPLNKYMAKPDKYWDNYLKVE